MQPKNSTDFSLEELKGFVGGYIEIVHIGRGQIMVVNEEGKLLGLPFNDIATLRCLEPIVGDVLVCDESEVR